MDKQAFKQRMQNLKSYRENNPGKGYWDWKIEAFQDVGIKPMDPDTYGSFNPAIPDYIFISNNQIVNKKPRVGLINHELGHKIDRQAGVFGSDGKVVRPIFNRDKI